LHYSHPSDYAFKSGPCQYPEKSRIHHAIIRILVFKAVLKEKGRAQKITNEYLGRITEDGFIPSKRRTAKQETHVTAKEHGASSVLTTLGEDVLNELKSVFPDAEL